ncbi:response regulator [Rubrivivax benzoatilyticus]|uniref:response regulator n=1 Tax=Rubrivivax benzoatilyticus TaxID=316997 RepID=UPI0035BEE7F2
MPAARRGGFPPRFLHAVDPTCRPPLEELQGTVLYIEDVEMNFAVVEGILARHPGIRLLRAANGLDGVRMVQECRPDFVLLDMHLPDISGLEVVRRLSEEIAERRLRITILTADTLTMDVLKAMSLGAFEYLVKPVEVRTIEDCVRRALLAKRQQAPGR